MKIKKSYIVILCLFVFVGASIKISVEYQRASWNKVVAKVLSQKEGVAKRGGGRKSGTVCIYLLAFEYQGNKRLEEKRIETSCQKGRAGKVVLLVNPKNSNKYSLDWGVSVKSVENSEENLK